MWKELIQLWRADNLLVQAWNRSYEMLEIARGMFVEAVRILRESDDVVMNRQIRQQDVLVNAYEQEVRRKVMTHCALQGPANLAGGMILISIVIDMERIGDYCKNILDLAEAHPQRLYVEAYEEILARMEAEIKQRFEVTIQILRNQDQEKARRLTNTYREEIGSICDRIDDNLVRGQVEGISPGDSAALALYARYLKRISAHLNNILTSVVNPFDRIGFVEKRGTSSPSQE